jgi:hypothetical protein
MDAGRRGPEVSVVREGDHAFRVEILAAQASTTHAVEVPEGLADELGWGDAGEADLVRASFAFLLEREPPTSILRRFSLDVIGSYFPEYPSEMRGRSPG